MFRSSADLFAELNHMQSLLDHMLPARGAGIRSVAGASFPPLNIGSTPAAIELQALAPGVDPAVLQITVDRGLLTIAGERKPDVPDDDNIHVYARERFGGSFRRVVSLPEDADPAQVDASYRDGILRVTVKRRESSQPRRIEVN
jgi:HSP20 family protein